MPQPFALPTDHHQASVSVETAAAIITVTCDGVGLNYPVAGPCDSGADRHFRFNPGLQALPHFNRYFGGRIPRTHFNCPVSCTSSLS